MGIWHQTKYLLRKNFQIKKRNKRETLQELLIPIWWVLLLLVIKLGVKTKEEPAVEDGNIPRFNLLSNTGGNSTNASVSLVGVVVEKAISKAGFQVVALLKKHSPPTVRYKGFNSSLEMVDYYKKYSESKKFGVGILFREAANKSIGYTIFVPVKDLPDVKTKLVGPGKSISLFCQ